MDQKINIAEILKDCPKGMELYSPIFGELKFNEVNTINNRILVVQQNDYIAEFESDGRLINCKNGECLLFPSKGKTTWDGFHGPFKDGDIVVNASNEISNAFVYAGEDNDYYKSYVGLTTGTYPRLSTNKSSAWVSKKSDIRLATEEEKAKLFDAIKDNGYKWNEETKTLEKFTPDKFDTTTLKPFDKVLVRDNNTQKWTADLFSFYDKSLVYPYSCVGHYTNQCIPYEGNEHLLGADNDCADYYKNW